MAKLKTKSASRKAVPKYPRQSLEKSLRIPKAILDQNAGKDCSDEESATFLGMRYNTGPYATELSSAIKYGLLERPAPGRVAVTSTAKKILRPQNEQQELEGLREAAMRAPDISSVYSHYRGENLPDDQFLENALVDKFRIPKEKVSEFKSVLFETLHKAKLLEVVLSAQEGPTYGQSERVTGTHPGTSVYGERSDTERFNPHGGQGSAHDGRLRRHSPGPSGWKIHPTDRPGIQTLAQDGPPCPEASRAEIWSLDQESNSSSPGARSDDHRPDLGR